jgi:sigma-B regulation protein RsbU (phosphoserine phosphatase)
MLLRKDGEAERLESTGLPLGMMAPEMLEMLGKGYEEKHLQINAGDLLALYSDGVTEAYDEDENEWGDERLLACLRSVKGESLPTIVTQIFEEIDRFAGAAPQHDDITILIFKRNN